ncbi:hypothetical protein FKM82_014146 [Ascaphus truei]
MTRSDPNPTISIISPPPTTNIIQCKLFHEQICEIEMAFTVILSFKVSSSMHVTTSAQSLRIFPTRSTKRTYLTNIPPQKRTERSTYPGVIKHWMYPLTFGCLLARHLTPRCMWDTIIIITRQY